MYKIMLEFDSLEELAEFLKKNQMANKEEVKVVYDLPTQVRHTRRKKAPWTQFDINYIIDNYHKYTAKQIAASLGRSPGAVAQVANKLTHEGHIRPKRQRHGKTQTNNLENV